MKTKKTMQGWILTLLFFSLVVVASLQVRTIPNSDSFYATPCDNSDYSNLVTLTTFPVDLDLLFWSDNLTIRNQHLNALGNGSWGWILTPWGGHFISGHHEGADKWYLYANRYLEVRAPHDGQFQPEPQIGNGSIIQIKGNDVVVDLGVDIQIGQDCSVGFGHIFLLESIFTEIQTTGSYSCVEGELLGYTPGMWALDFYYYYGESYESICPYPALSLDLQNQVDYYFSLQYERAKIGGVYPESDLCVPLDIGIENTVWGVWRYQTGPYDSYYENLDHFGRYELSFITFLSRDLTNLETFYKDPKDGSTNLTAATIGLFKDGQSATEIPGYLSIGECLVEQVQGNYTEGILKLVTHWSSDWEPSNTSLYAKIRINKGQEGYRDDLLTIEYFANLLDAQAGFTQNNLTYKRFFPYWDSYAPSSQKFTIPFYQFFSGSICVIIAFVIISKRKSP